MTEPPRLPIRPPLTTPLTWALGGALLTGTLWVTAVIALFRGVGSLFD